MFPTLLPPVAGATHLPEGGKAAASATAGKVSDPVAHRVWDLAAAAAGEKG